MPCKQRSLMAPLLLLLVQSCASIHTHTTQEQQHFFIGTVKSNVSAKRVPLSLSISSKQPGYLLCFFQEGDHSIRFFPNRFNENPYIDAQTVIRFPGDMPFKIYNSGHNSEKVGCFLTEEEVLTKLPEGLNTTDFTPLPYPIDNITQIIATIEQQKYLYAETNI